MNISNYQAIGHYLRDVRESSRISIADAASAMHIRPRYLTALEEGDFGVLPGNAYIRGYLKNYAVLLGIKPDDVLSKYDGVSGVTKQDYFIPEPTVKENLPSRVLLMVVAAIIALFAAYFMFFSGRVDNERVSAEEIPAELMLSLASKNNPRAKELLECLKSVESGCFIEIYSHDVVGGIDASRAAFLRLLSGL